MGAQPLLFIQGAGDMRAAEGSGHLADYLGKELGDDYRVIAPEMPDADHPRYRPWRDRIARELAAIDDEVVEAVLGPPQPGKAQLFEDQYICTGGQLYELMSVTIASSRTCVRSSSGAVQAAPRCAVIRTISARS